MSNVIIPGTTTTTILPGTTAAGIAGKLATTKGGFNFKFNKVRTSEIDDPFFRVCIYGQTSRRKTSTAAHASTPDRVRIVMTRDKEQLIPLQREAYDAIVVENASQLTDVAYNLDKAWPEWTGDDRWLVLDDVTSAYDLMFDDNSTNDQGVEVRDKRQVYGKALDAFTEVIRHLRSLPIHIVFVATAKAHENDISLEEEIGLELPPSANRWFETALEFVFYITDKYQFLTDRDKQTFIGKDDKGKDKPFTRTTFAKSKFALGTECPLQKFEPMDLGAIWNKVKQSRKGGK